ncbi:MAG: ribonuclease H family protein [Cellulosilyticaceae bacterium]
MDKIKLYCDGGCRGNGKKNNIGGWGVYLTYGEYTKEIYGHAKVTTNNIMELTACIEGLKAIKKKDIPVEVLVDSNYVLNGITKWIYGWMRNGWLTSKKESVENKELWIELYEMKKMFKQIEFTKVKGHSTNVGNNKADELANFAMDQL